VSLYRTWRPKSFADLVGQDAVVRTLRTALSSGKLAHAYLFSGPRGSGKTSAAKILARCIDCAHGPTPEPDNTCENCQAMLAGTALDVVEVDAASNRGIEEIRALRESVKFAPSSMRMKVFIIDEAHMLTREGANAFLKTLEEPPAHAVFILATTAPEALPATILSRCQRYAFRRIPISVMIERMREIARAEGIAIDDGALGAIAYRADGGLRDALTMLEQVAAYADASAGGLVDAATVDAAFGTTGRQFARAIASAIHVADAGAALRAVDAASDAGADMLGLIRGTIGEYRHLLVARIDPELLGRDLSATDAAEALARAQATPQPAIVRGLRLLADALAAARQSGNPRLELETAVLRLVLAREDPSLDALAARVALLEGGTVAPMPVASALAPPVATAAAPAPAAPLVPAPPVPAPSPASLRVASPPRTEAPAAAEKPAQRAASLEADSPPAPEPDDSPAVALARGTVTLQQVRSLWEQIRLRAEEKHKPMRALLSRATVDAIEGNALVIGIGDPIQEGLMRDKIGVLEDAVAALTSSSLRVIVKSRAAATAAPKTRPAPERDGFAATPTHASAARAVPSVPEARADAQNGEIDLLAYARERIGGPVSE
jgi:DNA polymerase-3 subunit gamma/tau